MREPPRIAWPVVALAVLMAVGGIGFGVVQAVRGDGGPGPGPAEEAAPKPAKLGRAGSEELRGGAPVTIADPPTSYRITYRVELDDGSSYEQRLAAVRPFTSSQEERRKDGTALEELGFGRSATRTPVGQLTVMVPAAAAGDPRPDAVMDDALELGVVERRERRRVAGRVCQVFRSGSTAAGVRFERATEKDHVDVCVDGRGLVLEEVEVVLGNAFRRRIATKVEDGVALDPASLTTLPKEQTLPANRGGGSMRPVRPDSEPQEEFFTGEVLPEGFVHQGRFSVVPPQAALAETERRSNDIVTSTDDVYVRGRDFIVVSRGGTLDFSPAFEPFPDGRSVDLGPVLGMGEVVVGYRGAEVRVAQPKGNFVRVYGTMPVTVLRDVARSLRQTPGGTGVVFLE